MVVINAGCHAPDTQFQFLFVSGITQSPDPGKFALNDEMFENFAYASYKKVKDVAHVLLRSYYLRDERTPGP